MKNNKKIKNNTSNGRYVSYITDLSKNQFWELEEIRRELPSGNIIKVSFDTEKIIDVFNVKALNTIDKSEKYEEGLKEILKNDLQEYKDDILEELERISDYKLQELYAKISIIYLSIQPQTMVEKMKVQAIIDKTVKEIFGNNTEEEISDLLVTVWLRREELSYTNVLDLI